MSTHAEGEFEIKNWDEKPYDKSKGAPKLTRSSVTQKFSGDIRGTGKVDYLMMYRKDKTASYVGMMRVTGSVGRKKGSFVLQCTGNFENGAARCNWSVVPGSGSGGLKGLEGKGKFKAPGGCKATYVFDYDFT